MSQTIDLTVDHDAIVAKPLNDRRVVLNKGAIDKISNGDNFLVFGAGEEIFDPKTGESLGILEEIKGKGKVVHLQEKICTIETYEYDTETVDSPLGIVIGSRTRKVHRVFVDVKCGDFARKIP